jgi:CO/xanthine dehydrogenase Mo-binding subunit
MSTATGGQVGRSVRRLEGQAKVTGRAEYVHNLRLPGMLYGKIFRSTVAHGRICSVDVEAACALPGVHRVVTIDDVRKVVPHPYYGPAFHDQPILADGKVHYIGEPVAVVLAADPHVAEQAVQLITAEYDELPAVFDEVEAMASAAVVHDGSPAHVSRPQAFKGKTIPCRAETGAARGASQGRLRAGRPSSSTPSTQQVLHLPAEPFAVRALTDWA